MEPKNIRPIQLNFSGLGCWLTLAIGFLLTATVGIGWLLKSLVALGVLIVLLPVLLVVGVQFWLKRNLVQGTCPSCGQALTGFKTIPQSTCMNCGISLQIDNNSFVRTTPEGTIDVDVVDMETGDATNAATIVDVEVLPPGE